MSLPSFAQLSLLRRPTVGAPRLYLPNNKCVICHEALVRVQFGSKGPPHNHNYALTHPTLTEQERDALQQEDAQRLEEVEFDEVKPITVLPCGHAMHRTCLEGWGQRTCPTCNAQYRASDLLEPDQASAARGQAERPGPRPGGTTTSLRVLEREARVAQERFDRATRAENMANATRAVNRRYELDAQWRDSVQRARRTLEAERSTHRGSEGALGPPPGWRRNALAEMARSGEIRFPEDEARRLNSPRRAHHQPFWPSSSGSPPEEDEEALRRRWDREEREHRAPLYGDDQGGDEEDDEEDDDDGDGDEGGNNDGGYVPSSPQYDPSSPQYDPSSPQYDPGSPPRYYVREYPV